MDKLNLLFNPKQFADAFGAAMRDSLAGLRRNVVTWLPGIGVPLRRAVYDEAGTALFTSEARDQQDELFDEWLEPPRRLFIFGAGDDAQPTAVRHLRL